VCVGELGIRSRREFASRLLVTPRVDCSSALLAMNLMESTGQAAIKKLLTRSRTPSERTDCPRTGLIFMVKIRTHILTNYCDRFYLKFAYKAKRFQLLRGTIWTFDIIRISFLPGVYTRNEDNTNEQYISEKILLNESTLIH